jgi:glucosylceramidase
MERKSGTWIATTAKRAWQAGGMLGTTRRGDANLALDRRQDQEWDGFGGGFSEAGWMALKALRGMDRNRILDALFDREDGCRFNLGRLPIGASHYAADWYSHDEVDDDLAMKRFSIARDRQHLIPYIREALQRQSRLRLVAVPWSPPTWMKESRVCQHGTLIGKPEILEAYALYFVRFVRAYQREGIAIHQVHVQNEPAAGHSSPGCLWTGAQLRDFIRGHLGPTFRRERLRAEIWLGTLNTEDYDGYTLTCLSDPLARQYLSGVGYQGTVQAAVQRTHAAWPDMRIWQTAQGCGDGGNTWDQARAMFALMQSHISNGARASMASNMVLRTGGRSVWGGSENSLVTVDLETRTWRLTPEYHGMRHFAQFIDKGAIRLGLMGEWAGNAVAFLNPDESRVLVVQNPLAEARRMVLAAGDRLVTAQLAPDSFNSIVL